MKGGKINNTQNKKDTKNSNRMLSVKNTTTTKWKAANDPNKPRKPLSPFFLFMEEFRKQFQEENPRNKSIAAIGKAGGIKWKAMSDAEKAPYVAESDQMKVEYEKKMASYNKKQVAGGNDVSNKFVSKVKKEEEEDSESDGYDQTMKRCKSFDVQKEKDTMYATTKLKVANDSDKPKRPVSPFFVFMEEFKKQFQEKNPHNKSIAAIGKAGGIKWKAMSDAEKAPYVAEYDKMKVDYKNIAAYNKKQVAGGNDVSDKFVSKVKKEEDDGDGHIHVKKESRPLDDVRLEDSHKDHSMAAVESSASGVYAQPNAVLPSTAFSYMPRMEGPVGTVLSLIHLWDLLESSSSDSSDSSIEFFLKVATALEDTAQSK